MDITLIVGIIAAIASLVAVFQSYRANRLSRLVVDSERSLEHPDISVDFSMADDVTAIVVAVPLSSNHIFEYPTSWLIRNSGERSAKNVEIMIRCSNSLLYGGSTNAVFTLSGGPKKLEAQAVSSSKHLETLLITVETLHPKQSYELASVFSLSDSTFMTKRVEFETQGKRMATNVEIEFSYEIVVTVAQMDEPPFQRRFTLGVIDTSTVSAKEFLDDYNKRLSKQGGSPSGETTKIRLIEIRPEQLLLDGKHPIHRVKAGESALVYEGIRFPDGYFIPALDVTMGIDLKKKRVRKGNALLELR